MSGRVRVLHVIGRMQRAGAETLLMHLLRNIDRSRFDVDVLVHSSEPGAYDGEIRELGFRVIPCPTAGGLRQYGVGLRRVMREDGPYDVVHSHVHHFSGFVMGAAWDAGVAGRIAQSHISLRSGRGAPVMRRAYERFARGLIGRFATTGLAVSSKAAEGLFGDDWQRDPRWQVFPMGIDFSEFRGEADGHALRRGLGIPDGAMVIGHVGRLTPQKNHQLVLRIAAEVMRRDDRAHLLCVGEGELRGELEEQACCLGIQQRVTFAGARSDIPEVMNGAMDVFLFPSLYEGLPVVALEAQAAGLPCVVSDAIAGEMDTVPTLVNRLSLDDRVEQWAEAVLGARDRAKVSRCDALAAMEASRFSVSVSVPNLEGLYYELSGR